jgi:hypothetical protein
MYGYITPDKPNLYMKDYALFRAFYCGTCKHLSRHYGQFPRLTTNYDITFLEAFVFSYENVLPEYMQKSCVLGPFQKKPMVKSSDLLDKLVAFNVLLSYHNLTDDVIDGEGLKKMLPRGMLKRGYKKARRKLPEINRIICEEYEKLRALEKDQVASFDRAADPFGNMMKRCIALLVSEPTDALADFSYHVGKYIYLIDALDDLEKDAKKHAYNPFLAVWEWTDRKTFLEAHGADIRLAVEIAINRCKNAYASMNLTLGKNLLDNLICLGLQRKFDMVYDGCKKAAKERI